MSTKRKNTTKQEGGGPLATKTSSSPLEGMVFAITGTLSSKRADFVSQIEDNGGIVKGSVTKEVTHLISARDDTAKAKKAKENGVEIVKEEQVVAWMNGNDSGAKKKEEEAPATSNKKQKTAAEETLSGPPLKGRVFAITGTLSMKRADFVSLIEENGGVVKGSVTKDVTHLVSASDTTAKAQKAQANGVQIITEQQVQQIIEGGVGGGGGGNPKETNKDDGPILHLMEPCSSNELHEDHGEYGFVSDREGFIADPEPLLEDKQYSAMGTAPPKARKLAQEIHDALDNAEMHAGEAGYTTALVVVISNIVGLDKTRPGTAARNKVLQKACMEALGVVDQARELVSFEKFDFNAKREVGFCNDDDYDDDPNEEINKATGIMADNLQDGFMFDLDPDQVSCAPVIYGGTFEGCIVGVTGYRVTT